MIQKCFRRIVRVMTGGRWGQTLPDTCESNVETSGHILGSRVDNPFNRDAGLNATEVRAVEAKLKEKDIRLMPYPFNHIMSLISDCDFSYPRNTWDVLSTLCYEMNIDYGDSVLMFDLRRKTRMSNSACCPSFGFADHMFRTHDDFRQMIELGLLDHVHGLWNPAPTGIVIPADRLQRTGPSTMTIDGLDTNIRDLRQSIRQRIGLRFVWTFPRTVFVDIHDADVPPPQVTLVTVSGRGIELVHAGSSSRPSGIMRHHYRVNWPSPGRGIGSHRLESIRLDGLKEGGDDHPQLRQVILLTTDRELQRRVIDDLAQHAGDACNLFVDHTASGFLTQSSEQRHREELEAILASAGPDDLLPCWLGRPRNGRGISMLPDDPESPLYVLDLLHARGFRYFNPSGSSGEPRNSLHPLQVISPTVGRDGTPLRVVRRIMPEQDASLYDESLSRKVNRKSRITTFAPRMMTVLNEAEGSEHKAFPFYTHLGADLEWETRTEQFDPTVVAALQDRIYNFSGNVSDDCRVACMRATDFYQYLDLVGEIADHCQRIDDDRIDITSWTDSHTGDRRPAAACQLQNLTFRVACASSAEVRLDSTPLPDLLRIGAHIGAAEEWVTVLSGGIRQRSALPETGRGEAGSPRNIVVPNVVGTIQFAGIEWAGDREANPGSGSWGIRIASRDGFSLYIGSRELYDQAGPASGTIFVNEWPEGDLQRTWFSLATADWSIDMSKPRTCFADEITVSTWQTGGVRQPIALLLLKPASSSERTIDPLEYVSFHAWRKHVRRTRCGIARTSNV